MAQKLAEITSYKLFDNHLSIGYAAHLFEWGSTEYVRFLRAVRLWTLEQLVKMGVSGTIFTFVYTPPGSDAFVRLVLATCQRWGIEPLFVRVGASKEVLLERLRNPDRLARKKLSRLERLLQMLDEGAAQSIPFLESLELDTGGLEPAQAAARIAEHYGLSR